MPITDVLQMMGRAGRPQYDTVGIAVVMVHAPKKNFYKRFLYEPFPVESSLADVLQDHLNAEIVAGTITCMRDAVDYLTWTYFFRRLLGNPTYYHLHASDSESLSGYAHARPPRPHACACTHIRQADVENIPSTLKHTHARTGSCKGWCSDAWTTFTRRA